MNHKVMLLSLLPLLFCQSLVHSCHSEGDIKLIVTIFDKKTDKEVKGFSCVLLKWFHPNAYNLEYETKNQSASGNNTTFVIQPPYNYIQIGIQSEGYYPQRFTIKEFSSSTTNLRVYLDKCKNVDTSNVVFIDNGEKSDAKKFPRLLLKNYFKSDRIIKQEIWGYDISTMQLTNNLTQADLWIDSTSDLNLGLIRLSVPKGKNLGIYKGDYGNTSPLMKTLDLNKVNVEWTQSHLLKKENDKIFLVTSKDNKRFAKLVIQPTISDIDYPTDIYNGMYDAVRGLEINFNIVVGEYGFQTLGYCKTIDLKAFLTSLEYQ